MGGKVGRDKIGKEGRKKNSYGEDTAEHTFLNASVRVLHKDFHFTFQKTEEWRRFLTELVMDVKGCSFWAVRLFSVS